MLRRRARRRRRWFMSVERLAFAERRRGQRLTTIEAYRAARTGFFCLAGTSIGWAGISDADDCWSIHSSIRDFLKRQRLPSLNAGIKPSEAYLYRLSGLMPR